MTAQLIDGNALAERVRLEVARSAAVLRCASAASRRGWQ
jgi:hypothetical protein